MPAGIDDGRIWQDQPDETNVQPVSRHLVDEPRPVRAAILTGPVEILVAECTGARRVDMRQPGHGRASRQPVILSDRVQQLGDDRQLGGRFYLRVGGEDLLDQGRAGAVQANNEDRRVARVTVGGALSEELRRENTHGAVDPHRQAGRFVMRTGGGDGIARRIMSERRFGFAALLKCPAKREVKIETVGVGNWSGDGAFHRLDFAVLEAVRP